jgi:hypothetical protein
LGLVPIAYRDILRDKTASPKIRLDACRDLLDRLGLPAVKATVSQALSAHMDPAEILRARDRLLAERDELKHSLSSIDEKLAITGEVPDAADEKGQKDQAGNGEKVRQEGG